MFVADCGHLLSQLVFEARTLVLTVHNHERVVRLFTASKCFGVESAEAAADTNIHFKFCRSALEGIHQHLMLVFIKHQLLWHIEVGKCGASIVQPVRRFLNLQKTSQISRNMQLRRMLLEPSLPIPV